MKKIVYSYVTQKRIYHGRTVVRPIITKQMIFFLLKINLSRIKIWYLSFVLASVRAEIIDTVQIFLKLNTVILFLNEQIKKITPFFSVLYYISYLDCEINLKKKLELI